LNPAKKAAGASWELGLRSLLGNGNRVHLVKLRVKSLATITEMPVNFCGFMAAADFQAPTSKLLPPTPILSQSDCAELFLTLADSGIPEQVWQKPPSGRDSN
jgi:hypothetical protein